MKTYTITTKNNCELIIEKYTLKEIINLIIDNYINNKEYLNEEQYVSIEYKDGSSYTLYGNGEEIGKFKKNGISKVIEDNGNTYSVYGFEPKTLDEIIIGF